MTHQQQSRPGFATYLADQLQRFPSIAAVEIARGFIGKDQLGAISQGPRDRHPLLLTRGKLARIMTEFIAQPHPL